MIYLFIGIAIIALTNLGTLFVITHYIDMDLKEENQRLQKKSQSRKKRQTKTKKRRRKEK